jgi:hypothetical protein
MGKSSSSDRGAARGTGLWAPKLSHRGEVQESFRVDRVWSVYVN